MKRPPKKWRKKALMALGRKLYGQQVCSAVAVFSVHAENAQHGIGVIATNGKKFLTPDQARALLMVALGPLGVELLPIPESPEVQQEGHERGPEPYL